MLGDQETRTTGWASGRPIIPPRILWRAGLQEHSQGLGPPPARRTGHSLPRQTLPGPPLYADTVLRAKTACGQGRQKPCWGGKNRVISEAEWAQEDLSEGATRDLRPVGGDCSVLGNMRKDKDLEAGMLLHVLKELEGGSGAGAVCAGAPEPPLSHLPAVRTIHALEMAFGGNAPTSCLARGD